MAYTLAWTPHIAVDRPPVRTCAARTVSSVADTLQDDDQAAGSALGHVVVSVAVIVGFSIIPD
jgi:hypothetical protein